MRRLVQGNEASAHAAIKAGLGFFAGYPITPSSEIAEVISRYLPFKGGIFMQMEDEIASINAIIGASLAGARVMTATSGPGFSLMQEGIGYAVMVEAPIVLVNIQRGGPSTGLPTEVSQGDLMQSRWGSHGDFLSIVLSPSSVKEMYELTYEAFNLAERFRAPVVVLSDEVVGHLREGVDFENISLPPIVKRSKPEVPPGDYHPFEPALNGVPPLPEYGTGYRFHVTGLFHNQKGFPTSDKKDISTLMDRLHIKIKNHIKEFFKLEEYQTADADILFVSYGITARSALEAVNILRGQGIKAGNLKLITLNPMDEEAITSILKSREMIFVPELNMGQLVLDIKRLGCKNRVYAINRYDGDILTPQQLIEEVMKRINAGLESQ
ncbi:MAG: 2-oxoglutarate oxidoreductase subunit KorA [candidate division WS2 bacterium]|nr:2-oxoglutarate oxidoreductase subunit KorA [Candidatus Lithacetigena glycinireducens]